MSNTHQNILIINYSMLSNNPSYRLKILIHIKNFLKSPPGLYNRDASELSEEIWKIFTYWIKQGNTKSFWHTENQGVRVAQAYQHYILLGIDQLLEDIYIENQQKPHITDFVDDIWLQARRYVATELLTEWTNQ